MAGFVVGVVERESVIDGASILEGDAVVGIPSSGLHTNGFGLVHQVFKTDEDPSALYRRYPEMDHSLGEELLIPHRCYYPPPGARAAPREGHGAYHGRWAGG